MTAPAPQAALLPVSDRCLKALTLIREAITAAASNPYDVLDESDRWDRATLTCFRQMQADPIGEDRIVLTILTDDTWAVETQGSHAMTMVVDAAIPESLWWEYPRITLHIPSGSPALSHVAVVTLGD